MTDAPADPSSPLQGPTLPTLPDAPSPPPLARVGSHVLLQRLGEGGMGEVWLAEQQHPVRRKVALKLMKETGGHATDALARFHSERQALALMSHPAIARVFETGLTSGGRLWFAMELVNGRPLTAWADEHRLSLRERLALFVRACGGVEHAHQRGILHRDLKPANILVCDVDGRAEPKIIDFGIAKPLEPLQGLVPGLTQAGFLVGTPEYMSPEQADPGGSGVDTRTDVYSLGVVLYELITGTLPLDPAELRRCSVSEIQRRIREQEPQRPSTRARRADRAAAEARGIEPDRWAKRLKGDLDWIVLRALAKDRERRYASVRELAEDIMRHLRDEPVMAGPPSLRYVAAKFARRHRLGVAVAASVTFALALGVAGTVAGLVRARRAEARAMQEAGVATRVSDLMAGIFELSAPERARGESMSVREALDRGVARIGDDLRDQPEVRGRLLLVLGRVHEGLGLLEQARAELEQSLALRRAASDPDDPRVNETRVRLGSVLRQLARHAEAEALLREARERALRIGGAEAASTLDAEAELAALWAETDRRDEAERLARHVLATSERSLGRQATSTLAARLQVARLASLRGAHDEARQLAADVLTARTTALGANDPRTLEARNVVADALSHLGQHAEATTLHEQNLSLLERVLGAGHPGALETLVDLAETHDRAGRLADAEAYYRRALDVLERERGAGHPETARARADLAALLYREGKLSEAEGAIRTAQASYANVYGDDHYLTVVNLGLLAVVVREQGRARDALELYRRVYEGRRVALGELNWETIGTLRRIADLEGQLGLGADRTRTLRTWMELDGQRNGTGSADHAFAVAEWHALLGRDDEALASLREAIGRGWNQPAALASSDAFASLRTTPAFAAATAPLSSPTPR